MICGTWIILQSYGYFQGLYLCHDLKIFKGKLHQNVFIHEYVPKRWLQIHTHIFRVSYYSFHDFWWISSNIYNASKSMDEVYQISNSSLPYAFSMKLTWFQISSLLYEVVINYQKGGDWKHLGPMISVLVINDNALWTNDSIEYLYWG
jgi:hypothetical protein